MTEHVSTQAGQQPPPLQEPWCAWAAPEFVDPDNSSLHVVIFVEDNEPGYYTTTYHGTLEYCKGVAKSINDEKGLTEKDASDMLLRSISAHMRSRT